MFTVYFYVISKKNLVRGVEAEHDDNSVDNAVTCLSVLLSGILSKRLNTSNFFHHRDRVATREFLHNKRF